MSDHEHRHNDPGYGHDHGSRDVGTGHGDHRDDGGHGHSHDDGGHGHIHDHTSVGSIMAEGSDEGIHALRISTVGLGATAAFQFVVVVIGGSVALLADALHNLGDVFTTIALWIAFVATRRAADHRYTFGYQRLEDMAGLVIVLAIFSSAGLAMYEGVTRLVQGRRPTHIALGIVAGVVGIVGNEAVAQIKIRAGGRIGSAALVAEGQHSRIDGVGSAGAVAGLTGVALGAGWADPVAGIVIAAVILYIGYDSSKPIIARLVDRVDPEIIGKVAREAAGVEDVMDVHAVRARHAGRSLYVLLHVAIPEELSLERAHERGEEVRHAILHALPQVVQVDVHIDPWGKDVGVYHETTSHHFDTY